MASPDLGLIRVYGSDPSCHSHFNVMLIPSEPSAALWSTKIVKSSSELSGEER